MPHRFMQLTPGLSFIAKSVAPKVVTAPAVILAAEGLLTLTGHEALISHFWQSSPGIILLSLAAPIAVAAFRHLQTTVRQKREMAELGAKPVPVVQGKWPGSIDLVLELLRAINEDYTTQFFQDNAKVYGNRFALNLMGELRIVTLNPKDMKQVIVHDFANWEKGEDFRDATHRVLGNGVFTSDGEMWKFHRSMTRPFFSRERISDFDIYNRNADRAVDLIKTRCEAGQAIDLQDLAGRFAMDSATEFLFGLSVGSMSTPLPLPKTSSGTTGTDNKFVVAFQSALVKTVLRLASGRFWCLSEILEDKTKKEVQDINEFLMPIVDKALERKREEKLEEQDEVTLLEHLAKATDDRDTIRDELLNMLIAGRDTTAHAITSVFYFLSNENPRYFKALREEIIQALGHDVPPYDTIKSMKYLRAVINETLRLFPAVPLNTRRSNKASVWTDEDGTKWYIPGGTQAMMHNLGLHRRKDLWGPDADEFDPERWLDDRYKQYYLSDPSIYLPFHAGPRICLGQQFAINEISFFVIRMLQAFDSVEFVDEAFPDGTLPPENWKTSYGRKAMEKVHPKSHLTTYINGGMWLKFQHSKEVDEE